MTFGEKVRLYRRQKRWTQRELAEQLGVSTRTVVSYENGTSYPKQRETYDRLAALFGLSRAELIAESEPTEEPLFASPEAGRAEAERLVTEMRAMFSGGELSEEDRDAVMRALQQAYWDARERKATS